ncbi:MAG: 50S ribosomal protein L33 [Deltaproteobacteria bacterium]|nr:50S ribosomal protein L33 [Deltaproteobacteria bacterium]
MPREIVQLQCTECKRKNYSTTKNKKKHPARLEIKKFCPFDRRHTVHREVK